MDTVKLQTVTQVVAAISPDVGRIVNINTVYLKCFKIFTLYEI